MQIQEDFDMRRTFLHQDNQRKRENKKIMVQTRKETQMVDLEVKDLAQMQPDQKAQAIKKRIEVYRQEREVDLDAQKAVIDNQYKVRIE